MFKWSVQIESCGQFHLLLSLSSVAHPFRWVVWEQIQNTSTYMALHVQLQQHLSMYWLEVSVNHTYKCNYTTPMPVLY